MVFRRPLVVPGGYLLNERLVLGCQVLLFRSVPDVVHLPGAAVGGHQLELVCQGGAVPLVFPEDGAGRAGIGDVVPDPGRRNLSGIGPVGVERLAVHVGRDRERGPREAGGRDVLKQEGGVVARAGTDFGRVADDEGRGQSPVKGFNFILAVGGIGNSGPHGAVPVPAARFPQGADGKNGFLVSVILGHFRRCPVVRQEDDDGVAAEAVAVQGGKDAAYAAVHDGDLGGIGSHACGKVVLAFRSGLFIARGIEFACHAQFGGRGDDSYLLLFFQPFGGDGVGGFASVGREHFFYLLPGGLEGRVRSRVSHVKEEGFFASGGIVKVGQGRSGDVIRHVEVLRQVFRLEQFSVFPEGAVRHGLVVVRRAAQQSAVTVEAAVPRVGPPDFSQVPFSGKVGAVARFFQELRQGGNVRIQASAVAGASAVVVQQPYVHLVGFASRHDGSAGRGAAGSRVAPGGQHALPGEGVQGRSGYFRPVASKV